MNALFDSEDEVKDLLPTKRVASENLGGWIPPPNPWVKDSNTVVTTTHNESSKSERETSNTVAPKLNIEVNPENFQSSSLTPLMITNPSLPQPSSLTSTITAEQNKFQQQEEWNLSQLPQIQTSLEITPFLEVKQEFMAKMPEIPPQQQEIPLLQKTPANLIEVPRPKLNVSQDSVKPFDDEDAWNAFLNLKKKTEESVSRMTAFYDQVVKLQFTHEQEAMSCRDAYEATISKQRKSLDLISSNYKDALLNNERLKELLEKKSQELMEYEMANYNMSMRLKELEQRCAHVEDRANIAETGRKIVEIRQRELELSLEYTTEIIKELRNKLKEFNKDKDCALQEQYELYEGNRRDLIKFYTEREKEIVKDFNNTAKKLQEMMINTMKEREDHLSKCWQDIMYIYQQQHNDIINEIKQLRYKEEKDNQAKFIQIEQDKERWYNQYRNEMTLLEQRHKDREQHALTDIARRERELGEREQEMRLRRAKEEQDVKVELMSKEVELKAYYQKIIEEMRVSFDKERDKLTNSFREHIQELSQLHLNNERELERMHRDKEREMAQRYRIAGYEVDDRKGEVDLRGVSLKTQSALLSKFDTIEARQRERAEKARAALQGVSKEKDNSSDTGK